MSKGIHLPIHCVGLSGDIFMSIGQAQVAPSGVRRQKWLQVTFFSSQRLTPVKKIAL